MMPIVDAYPVLLEFKADGNIATLKSLKLWLYDYHLEPPKTAVNDNSPDARPIEWETHIDAERAENLIRAMAEDENCERNPDFKRSTTPYSATLHDERFERIKHTGKEHPPAEEIDAEGETIRYIDAVRMRTWLGSDADVLDMAVDAHSTFDDIGQHIGTSAAEAKQEVIDVASVFYKRAA